MKYKTSTSLIHMLKYEKQEEMTVNGHETCVEMKCGIHFDYLDVGQLTKNL